MKKNAMPTTFRQVRAAVLAMVSCALSTALITALSGCTTDAPMTERSAAADGSRVPSTRTYAQKIDEHSAGEADYNGFYNNFIYKATILNSEIRSNLLERQTESYQWDHAKVLVEREKSDKEMASQTSVFMSFFTPDHKNDNLSEAKSIWQIYLDVNGQRFVGKAKKLRTLLAETQSLYPFHTRWNTPYMISFPTPTTAVENRSATLTVTGPLGTRTVELK